MVDKRISELDVTTDGPNADDLIEYSRSLGGSPEAFGSYRARVGEAVPAIIQVACSDETTDLTTGTAKITFRIPKRMRLLDLYGSLTAASSSGVVTVDLNRDGASILDTKLTIDANEKTSVTAETPPVIIDDSSDGILEFDDEMTVDIDTAGTGAKGLKLTLVGEYK